MIARSCRFLLRGARHESVVQCAQAGACAGHIDFRAEKHGRGRRCAITRGVQWQARLIMVMLEAFGAGVAASLAQMASLRRELAASRRKTAVLHRPAVPAAPAPTAHAI
jgi:hypothetical protein